MDDRFFRVLFPGEHRVLGRTLPPLTHWHQCLLWAFGSPFLTGAGDVGLGDIQLAVRVVHTPWPQRPSLRRSWRDIWINLRYGRNLAFVRAHAEAFAAYRAAHELRPEFWEREDEIPKKLTAPFVLARVAQLMRLARFTHAQAWNEVTPGYAAWLVATLAEQQGAELRFLYDSDEEPDDLPDLNAMSEEELLAQITADVGPAEAVAFMARRDAYLEAMAEQDP